MQIRKINIVDYDNWKTRKILGMQTEGSDDIFFTVHMGWWNDGEEPLKKQWKKKSTDGVMEKAVAL